MLTSELTVHMLKKCILKSARLFSSHPRLFSSSSFPKTVSKHFKYSMYEQNTWSFLIGLDTVGFFWQLIASIERNSHCYHGIALAEILMSLIHVILGKD